MQTLRTATTPVSLALTAALVAGCGASSPPGVAPSAATAAPTVGATLAPSASVDPGPAVIDPGTVDPEPALQLLWKGAAPGSTETDWVTNPVVDQDGRIWGGASTTEEFWVFERDGTYVDSWDAGSRQHESSGLFGQVAFAPDGRLYVVDAGAQRVVMFDTDRKKIGEWGGFGSEPDEFYLPNRIVTDAAGNVYVHDVESGAVKKFDADGTPIFQYELASAPSMAVDDGGHVYVVTTPDKHLTEVAPDGTVVRAIDVSTFMDIPVGIRLTDDGSIWLCGIDEGPGGITGGSLLEFHSDGKLRRMWQDVTFEEFAIDPAGDQIYTSVAGVPYLAAYALPVEAALRGK